MPEGTDFLYPFIDAHERDAGSLLIDLAASASAKTVESARVTARALEANRDELRAAASGIAARLRTGGRLYTFGNGGSSTDAASLAALFATPPSGPPVAARCLVDDTAIVTALGNDVGFELVFSRQLIAYAGAGDIAVGLSTSGNSRNLLAAFAEAAKRSMLTIGIAGYDGGEMAAAGLDHCLVVRNDSVHRIQEAQASLGFALWREVQARLAPTQAEAPADG
jgi:D-sedoheptulose 7-phosphate isomerase